MSNGTVGESNSGVIKIVVITLAVNGTIGLGTLAYCLVSGREPNSALLTAFVGLVNYILGGISGMLVKTSPTTSIPSEPKPSGTVTVPEQTLETQKT
jgi:hypothetical protein